VAIELKSDDKFVGICIDGGYYVLTIGYIVGELVSFGRTSYHPDGESKEEFHFCHKALFLQNIIDKFLFPYDSEEGRLVRL
jgi:hypothetical protein